MQDLVQKNPRRKKKLIRKLQLLEILRHCYIHIIKHLNVFEIKERV